MIAGVPDFARDRDHRRIFEVESTEHADDIERLQHQILIFACECIAQVESEHFGREVWLGEADNLSMSD